MTIAEKLEQNRTQLIKEKVLSDEFLDFTQRNMLPLETLFTYYSCAIMEVETKFRVLNEEYKLRHERNPIENIRTRLKSPDSLLRKVRRLEIPLTLESIEQNITDIAGVRVICSFLDDVYMLADFLTSQDDITLLTVKDYIKDPKPSGYRSLHLIISVPIFLQHEKRNVTVEVQLRTLAMDSWASLDHKLRYKKDLEPEAMAALEKELSDCARINAELDTRMQDIRNRYWHEEADANIRENSADAPFRGHLLRFIRASRREDS